MRTDERTASLFPDDADDGTGAGEADVPTGVDGPASQAHAEPGGGLRWDVVEIVARAPKRLIPHVLQMIVTLRHADGMTMGMTALAKAMKTTPTIAASCIEHAPQVLESVRKGTAVALRTSKAMPWEIDRASLEEIDKRRAADEKKRQQEAARAAKDSLDTPFNRLRIGVENLGMITADARTFAGFLMRTYGLEAAQKAVTMALEAKPGEPKSYVISLLKRSVALGDQKAGTSRFVQTVRAVQRPDGTGRTSLIGWEADLVGGLRHKLFRLPNGHLRREPPEAGETTPGFAQDPGWRVSN